MIVIDGHNLLWAVQGLADGAGVEDEVALCKLLSKYLRMISENGQIIFDGTGPSDKSIFDNIVNLDVFFSGLKTEADSVIEDKISTSSATREMTVISSDRRLRKAAQARKAKVIKADDFWVSVQKELTRKRGEREPSAKHHGLSESETDRWMEMFDLD